MMITIWHTLQRFIRWLFGSPFQALPPEFGNAVPLELREFEAELEGSQNRIKNPYRSTPNSAKKSGQAITKAWH
jgi:hypothetical protein